MSTLVQNGQERSERNGLHRATFHENEVMRIARLEKMIGTFEHLPWLPIKRSFKGIGEIGLLPINKHFAEQFGVVTLEKGEHGFSSTALKIPPTGKNPRLANFWLSSYRSPDGVMELSFLRSGSPIHYGITDRDARRTLSRSNVAELHGTAEVVRKGARLVSIDLQSPDASWENLLIEKAFVAEKEELLKERGSEIRHLVIPTHQKGIQTSQDKTIVAAQRHTIEEILQRAAERGRPEFVQVRELFSLEVRTLLDREAEGKGTAEGRYALGARLVFLIHDAGDLPHFNCRSGKDRTGFLDVEAKFLAYQVYRIMNGERISHLGEARLPEEEAAWKTFLLQGGNLEIQKLNTGYPGSKLDQSTLKRRVGEENWGAFIADSRLAEG